MKYKYSIVFIIFLLIFVLIFFWIKQKKNTPVITNNSTSTQPVVSTNASTSPIQPAVTTSASPSISKVKKYTDGSSATLFTDGQISYMSGGTTMKLAKPQGWVVSDREDGTNVLYLESNISSLPEEDPGDNYYIWTSFLDKETFDTNLSKFEETTFENSQQNFIKVYKSDILPSRSGELVYFMQSKDGHYLSVGLAPYNSDTKPYPNQDEVMKNFELVLKSIQL